MQALAINQKFHRRPLHCPQVPLMMAYVTRYIYGTDKLRTNAFEVRGLNGISSGVIHCDDLAILSQWLKLITDNIVGLTQLQVGLARLTASANERRIANNIIIDENNLLCRFLAADEIVQSQFRYWRTYCVHGLGERGHHQQQYLLANVQTEVLGAERNGSDAIRHPAGKSLICKSE